MFVLNIVLIGLAGMENYGQFVLVYALSLIAFGAQNALVLMPMNVLVPAERVSRARVVLRMLATIDIGILGLAALVVTALTLGLGLPVEYGLCAFALVITNGMRELHRSLFLTQQRAVELLRLDGAAVVVAGLAFVALLSLSNDPTMSALSAICFGNLAAVAVFSQRTYRSPLRLSRMARLYRPYWLKSRWALVGAGLTEAHLRLYVVLVEIARGSSALGVLHAGRVLVNPVSLVAFAWARSCRPIIARKIAKGDQAKAFEIVCFGMALLLGAGALYLSVLWTGLPYLAPLLDTVPMADLSDLLVFWSVCSLVSLPSICLSVFFQATHNYRLLTVSMAFSVAVSMALMLLLFLDLPLAWAVMSLIVGEAVLLAGLLFALLPQLQQRVR